MGILNGGKNQLKVYSRAKVEIYTKLKQCTYLNLIYRGK